MNLASLNHRAQIWRLRKLAERALKSYQLKKVEMSLLVHGENTTFKVTCSNKKKYVLRIHRLGYHSDEGISAELVWLQDLASNTFMKVPQPVPGKDGKYIQNIQIDSIDSPRSVVLFEWLDGRFLGKGLTPKKLEIVGSCTAKLQKSAKKYGTKIIQNRLRWDVQTLTGRKDGCRYFKHLNKKEQKIFSFMIDELYKELEPLTNNSKYFGLIHADLHWGNFFFNKDKICIIDFDDYGSGYYMLDLAVTLLSLRRLPKREQLRKALLEGYSNEIPISEYDLHLINLLYIARHICLLDWVSQRSDLVFLQRTIPDKVQKTIAVCERYKNNKEIIF